MGRKIGKEIEKDLEGAVIYLKKYIERQGKVFDSGHGLKISELMTQLKGSKFRWNIKKEYGVFLKEANQRFKEEYGIGLVTYARKIMKRTMEPLPDYKPPLIPNDKPLIGTKPVAQAIQKGGSPTSATIDDIALRLITRYGEFSLSAQAVRSYDGAYNSDVKGDLDDKGMLCNEFVKAIQTYTKSGRKLPEEGEYVLKEYPLQFEMRGKCVRGIKILSDD